jgi:hypothetical protein
MLRRQHSVSMQRPRTVTNARSLQGLMKWLSRAEWRDRFAEVYDHHLLPACRRTGFDAEEVMEILGESWFMTTVWGCAFEDFLTSERPGGRNIVDDYLKRRGWKEGASARAYMSALRTSVMSLYEVSDIVRDTSFRARDLVRGGDPILISERSATRSLKQWDRIAARVVPIGSQMHISGAVLPYDRDASEKVLKLLRNVAKRTDKEQQKLADLVRRDVNDPAIVNAFSQTAFLRAAAPTITTVWLIDIIDRAAAPQIPDVRNTEGDALLFCTVHYPFASGVAADDIRLVLNRCPELRPANATFWNWVGPEAKDLVVQKQPLKSQTFTTTLDDGSLVLGNVELKDQALILSCARRARARAAVRDARWIGGSASCRDPDARTVHGNARSRTDAEPEPVRTGAPHHHSWWSGPALSGLARSADPCAWKPVAARRGKNRKGPRQGRRLAQDARKPHGKICRQ